MSSGSVGDMWIGSAIETYFFGGIEYGFIKVGGGPAKRDPFIGSDVVAFDLRIHRTLAPDMSQGSDQSSKLFSGGGNELWFFPNRIELLNMGAEVGDDGGYGVNDGVAPTGEGEVGEALHLVSRQGSTQKGGLGEGPEEILTGFLFGPIKLFLNVAV